MSAPQRTRTSASGWRLAVDVGGTFTDLVLQRGEARFTAKVLTTPRAPEEAVLAGIEQILDASGAAADSLESMIFGTTLATNALIERKGAVTALITTEGFRDVVEIGLENRFSQYDVFLDKPAPLVPRRLRYGVPERIDAAGRVRLALDEDAVRALVPLLRRAGVQSVAVALLHSYVDPRHEQRIREILLDAWPELWITLSCEVCPEVREYERTSTACANAYVQPIMSGYLRRLQGRLAQRGVRCPLFLMTSGGAITTLERGAREPVRLVESGPAGGAVLAREVAAQCGVTRALSFDMGGTTAKVCFIDDFAPAESRSFEFGRMYRFLKGSGLPIRIPVIEMVEIGAGGGSIARLDELQRVQVGPDSAGAEPGPACYGRGGSAATVTDADAVLGRLDPDRFAGGSMALDVAAAREALARELGAALAVPAETAALAVSEIVEENMANAARVHAMELGKTVEDYTLIAFGGAAPLHAARLAQKLGIRHVIVPSGAAVGSALGFLWAPVAFHAVRSFYQRLDRIDVAKVNELVQAMSRDATGIVRGGAPRARLEEQRSAFMRYVGQGHEITVALPARALRAADAPALRRDFETEYARLYGRAIPHLQVEVLSWSLVVRTRSKRSLPAKRAKLRAAPRAPRRQALYDPRAQRFRDAAVFDRAELRAGTRFAGPALVAEDQTTTVVGAGCTAEVDTLGYLHLRR
ncbi:MAG: hydantoinase/oxoprolinase family protein [Burkholderiales bacterium]|nr:hydantoinase/oxoprolinase family protein [Burkholderiales bacterium]